MNRIFSPGIWLLASAALCAGFPCTCARAQDPQELIRRIDGQQQKIQTLTGSFVQRKETTLVKDPLISSGTVHFQRPNRIHWVYKKPEPLEVAISGEKMEVYHPRKKQLEQYSLAPGRRITRAMEPLLQIFQKTFGDLGERYTISYEGVEAGDQLHFRLEPKEERVRKILARVELWIDKGNGAILRLAMTEANGDRLSLEFRDLQINPALKPEDLEIQVPPSARAVEASG